MGKIIRLKISNQIKTHSLNINMSVSLLMLQKRFEISVDRSWLKAFM